MKVSHLLKRWRKYNPVQQYRYRSLHPCRHPIPGIEVRYSGGGEISGHGKRAQRPFYWTLACPLILQLSHNPLTARYLTFGRLPKNQETSEPYCTDYQLLNPILYFLQIFAQLGGVAEEDSVDANCLGTVNIGLAVICEHRLFGLEAKAVQQDFVDFRMRL